MMRALYTAATGMRAEQTNVDTIANNLSNVNTTGFKGQRTEFKSLLYQTIQTRSTSGNGDAKPVGAQVGLGTRVAATTSTYTQGPLNSTERPTDFALEGDGFFAVRGTDNQTYYTRNGAFTWSQYGNGQTILTDSQGNPVMDTNGNIIAVPAGVKLSSLPIGLGCIRRIQVVCKKRLLTTERFSQIRMWLVKRLFLSKAMELRVLGLHMIMMPGTIRIRMRKDSLTEVEPIQFLS